jgi:hypothetical protein
VTFSTARRARRQVLTVFMVTSMSLAVCADSSPAEVRRAYS